MLAIPTNPVLASIWTAPPTGFLAATFPSGTIANTTNITAGTIATTTNLTNLPSIPANWITAAGITAGALNGKGDWLLASSYTAPLTSTTTAQAVWNAVASSYTVSGSMGALLNDAGALVDPLSELVPGVYASGTAGAALGRIGSGIITVLGPSVLPGGNFQIVAGCDYLAADTRAFQWTDSVGIWPTLVGAASITLTLYQSGVSLFTAPLTATVTAPAGQTQTVQLQLTRTQQSTIPLGSYPFGIVAICADGSEIELVGQASGQTATCTKTQT